MLGLVVLALFSVHFSSVHLNLHFRFFRHTYAMSRNVNFWLVQRLIFVSTAYLGPIEPISIVTQIKSGGRFQSSPKMLIFLNFFWAKIGVFRGKSTVKHVLTDCFRAMKAP